MLFFMSHVEITQSLSFGCAQHGTIWAGVAHETCFSTPHVALASQKGWVSIRGKKWYGYFRRAILDPETNEQKTASIPVALGLKSEMTKTQARQKLESEIVRLTGQTIEDGTVKNGTVTFGWFVRNRYLPLKEADWREETAKIKKYLIQADLVDEFEAIRLENFDKFTLQNHLNRLAKTHSKDRVLQIRSYMQAIFGEAVDQDFLSKDLARIVKPPANLREVDKMTLTWDQLRAALAEDAPESRDSKRWRLIEYFSIFTVGSGVVAAAINNLILVNGYTSTVAGAIQNFGTLTVTDTTFANNYAGAMSPAEGTAAAPSTRKAVPACSAGGRRAWPSAHHVTSSQALGSDTDGGGTCAPQGSAGTPGALATRYSSQVLRACPRRVGGHGSGDA